MLTVSTLLLFISVNGINCHILPVLAVGGIATIAIWLEWGRKMSVYSVLIFVFGFILIGFVMENHFAINSVAIFYNNIADIVGRSGLFEPGKFVVDVAESVYPLYLTYFMALMAAFVGLISYLVVAHKQKFFLYLYCIIIGAACVIFGFESKPVYLAFFVLTVVLISFYHSTGKFKLSFVYVLAGLTLIMALSLFAADAVNRFTGVFESPYETLSDKIKYAENITDSYGTGKIAGNDYVATSQTALIVTLDEPKPMYLKGFTAATFNGSRWVELEPEAAYDNRELFHILDNYEFKAYNQISKLNQIIDSEAVSGQVRVEYSGAGNEYVYLPYEITALSDEVLLDERADYIKNQSPDALGYSFTMTTPLYTKILSLSSDNKDKLSGELYADFAICESNYADYVHETYLDVDDRDKHIIEAVFERNGISFDAELDKDNSVIIEQIKTVLNNEMEYDKNVDISVFERNCLDLLLNQEKKGYDIHFSTIATLMFRVMGIPARYVEGYIIPITDSVKMKSGEAYYVKGSNAHAWTEIYVADTGWTPVEVCEEYYLKMFASPDTEVEENAMSAENSSVTDTKQDKYNNEGVTKIVEKSTISAGLIIIPICILVLFAVVFIRRTIIIKKRNALLKSVDYNKAILGYYGYLCQVLRCCGLLDEGKNMSEVFVTYMSALDKSEKESFSRLLKIFEKAEYSGKAMKEKDVRFTSDTVQKTIEAVTDNQKIIRNIFLYLFVGV